MSDLTEQMLAEAKLSREALEAYNARKDAEAAAAPAPAAVRMTGGSLPDSTLKEFLTPGSPVKEYWCKPGREQIVGKAQQFVAKEGAAPYLTSDVSTTGSGYFFTPELYRNVVMGLIETSGVLEANPTLILTDHLRPIQVPVLEVDAVATAGTEGSPATPTNTEGDAVTLGHFRYDGSFAVSREIVMASEYRVEDLLATFATRAVGNKVAEMLAVGAGSTEPVGIFTGAAVGKTCASATVVTPEDVIALTKSVGKGYRKQARMVASDEFHTAMLNWREDDSEGTGGFLLRSLDEGGYQIAGKPVYTEPQADSAGISANDVVAVYGDVASGYFVRMTPMLWARNDADPLNLVFTFAIWIDANIADAGAVKSLKMGAGGT
jgi:HK97 family phage major capsid protein